jgi:hypothetical protein
MATNGRVPARRKRKADKKATKKSAGDWLREHFLELKEYSDPNAFLGREEIHSIHRTFLANREQDEVAVDRELKLQLLISKTRDALAEDDPASAAAMFYLGRELGVREYNERASAKASWKRKRKAQSHADAWVPIAKKEWDRDVTLSTRECARRVRATCVMPLNIADQKQYPKPQQIGRVIGHLKPETLPDRR